MLIARLVNHIVRGDTSRVPAIAVKIMAIAINVEKRMALFGGSEQSVGDFFLGGGIMDFAGTWRSPELSPHSKITPNLLELDLPRVWGQRCFNSPVRDVHSDAYFTFDIKQYVLKLHDT